MKFRNKAEIQKFWRREIEYWLSRLRLDNWMVIYRDMADVQDLSDEEKRGMVAYVQTYPSYLTAVLYLNYDLIKEGNVSEAELKDTACHEVVHMVLSRMTHFVDQRLFPLVPKRDHKVLRDLFEDAVESVTTHLSRTVMSHRG